jgi:hypothetical protein
MRPEVASARREAKIICMCAVDLAMGGGLLVLAMRAGLSAQRVSR